MQKEDEITVKVTCSYEEIVKCLEQKGFNLLENFVMNDIYMIRDDIDISTMKSLDVLKNCILIREFVGIEKELLYKYKKYDDNGDVLEQGKVSCPILDIQKALEFMKAIKYRELFHINDNCFIFFNKESQFVLQVISDDKMYIEMELEPNYVKGKLETLEELKKKLLSYNLPIDSSDFFVKKAEIMLNEVI